MGFLRFTRFFRDLWVLHGISEIYGISFGFIGQVYLPLVPHPVSFEYKDT